MTPPDPLRILVLEDEPMILMELCLAMEDHGAVAVSTNTAEKALGVIGTSPPDAAVLDVHLGRGMTCEEVAQELKRHGIPFILHSGDLVRQGELIARIGAEVVAKPASSDSVAGRVLALARKPDSN